MFHCLDSVKKNGGYLPLKLGPLEMRISVGTNVDRGSLGKKVDMVLDVAVGRELGRFSKYI